MRRRYGKRAHPFFKELNSLKGKVSFNLPMRRYTTMRVGGEAAALYQPRGIEDLRECVRLCRKNRISYLVLGSGSNIIFDDRATEYLIIKLSAPAFRRIEICDRRMACGSGVLLNELCRKAEEHSLGGAEFLFGIPGTIGGAIIQNAGAHGSSIADIVKDVKILDRKNRVGEIKRGEIGFGYRKSGLEDIIVLGATLRLRRSGKAKIRRNIKRLIEERLSTQDYTAPSAGCIFKNPEGLSAGALIDRCGLKGKRVGGACISQRHANFIINKNHASARDILKLISLTKKAVRKKFGIILTEEVKIIR